MWSLTILTVAFLCYVRGDIFFPEDTANDAVMEYVSKAESSGQSVQQTPIQSAFESSNIYDKFVYDVIAQGVTNLCLGIDRSVAALNSKEYEDYVVYSPLSISSALALVLLGANGKTFEELSSLLGLAYGLNIVNNSVQVHEEFGALISGLENSGPKDTQQIKFASGLFVQNDFPIREQYKSTSMSVYRSDIMNLDFRNDPEYAKKFINNWVSEKTFGKIKDILTEDPPTDTRVVIVSSLYFISEWDNPFDSGITKRHLFYPNGKDHPSTIQVDLMANGGDYPYHNDSSLNCQIIGLPYKGKTTTFYIVIPHNSSPQRLRELENSLTANEITRLVRSTKKTRTLVAIPKMKLSSTLSLNKVLQNLGLNSLFNPRESNLGLLTPGFNPNMVKPEFEQMGQMASQNGREMPADSEKPFIFATRLGNENATENAKRRRKRQNLNSKLIKSHDYTNSLDYIRHMLDNNKDTSNPGLYASQVLHKVFIDVTEKGTEAAAATGVSLSRDGSRIIVKADVPFFFFILHEQTKLVLFWGSVNNPSPHYS